MAVTQKEIPSFCQVSYPWPSRTPELHRFASGLLNFLLAGCKVVMWDIDQDKLHDVVNEIKAFGGVVFPYECNLRNKDEIYKTAERVKEEVGKVSLLVNNAGIVTGKKLLDSTDDEILSTFDVNSFAHFWVSENY